MAIDTENKRASATNLFLFQVPPAPDGAVSAADRSHLDVYAGIATDVLNMPTGLVSAGFSGRVPGVTMTARKPGATITGYTPGASFST